MAWRHPQLSGFTPVKIHSDWKNNDSVSALFSVNLKESALCHPGERAWTIIIWKLSGDPLGHLRERGGGGAWRFVPLLASSIFPAEGGRSAVYHLHHHCGWGNSTNQSVSHFGCQLHGWLLAAEVLDCISTALNSCSALKCIVNTRTLGKLHGLFFFSFLHLLWQTGTLNILTVVCERRKCSWKSLYMDVAVYFLTGVFGTYACPFSLCRHEHPPKPKWNLQSTEMNLWHSETSLQQNC